MSTGSTFETTNVFCHFPPRRQPRQKQKQEQEQKKEKNQVEKDTDSAGTDSPSNLPTVLFHITGNPGVLGYYHEFLHLLLRQPLDCDDRSSPSPSVSVPVSSTGTDNKRTEIPGGPIPAPASTVSAAVPTVADRCVVVGYSLGGFEDDRSRPPLMNDRPVLHVGSVRESVSSSPLTSSVLDNHPGRMEVDLGDLMIYPADLFRDRKQDGGRGRKGGSDERSATYGLRDQIDLCCARLEAVVDKVRRVYSNGDASNGDKTLDSSPALGKSTDSADSVKVVLIGHSLGTYISLEMIKTIHRRRRQQQQQRFPTDNPQVTLTDINTSSLPPFSITTAILLTPTIQDLAKSSKGQFVTSSLMSILPFIPSLVNFGTSVLSTVLPKSTLRWIVKRASGFQDMRNQGDCDDHETIDADVGTDMRAKTAAVAAALTPVDAALRFVQSPRAIRQTSHLVKEEMEQIAENDWAEEVWGFDGTGSNGHPKLFLWFAKKDGWIADATRAEIIGVVDSKRNPGNQGQSATEPVILVDDEDNGLVHDWCVAHSELVANRVGRWLGDILHDNHQ